MNGKTIEEKLISLGIKKNELAERIGTSPQNIQRILASKDIKTSFLEKVSKVTNRPLSYFYSTEPAFNCTIILSSQYSNHLPDIDYNSHNSFLNISFVEFSDIVIQISSGITKELTNHFMLCSKSDEWITNRTYLLDTKSGLLLTRFGRNNNNVLSFEDYENPNRTFDIEKKEIITSLKVNAIIKPN